MPEWHIDYFKSKWFKIEPVQEEYFDSPLWSLKVGNKSPLWKVFSLDRKNIFIIRKMKIQGQDAYEQRSSSHFTNL